MDDNLTGAWRGLRPQQVYRAATRDEAATRGLERLLETLAHLLRAPAVALVLARDDASHDLHPVATVGALPEHGHAALDEAASPRPAGDLSAFPIVAPDGAILGELRVWPGAREPRGGWDVDVARRGAGLVLDHLELLTARLRADQETERLIFVEALAASLGETRSLEEAMDLVLAYVCEYADWPFAEAWIPSERGDTLRRVRSCRRAAGLEAFDAAGHGEAPTRGSDLAGRAWGRDEVVFEPRYAHPGEADEGGRAALANDCGLHTGLAIPVRGTHEVLAIVCFYHRDAGQVSPELLRFVSVVIGQLSGPLARARGEASLRATERGHRALFDVLANLVVTTDSRGRVTYCNDAFLRAVEYRRADVIGREFLPLFSRDPRADRWRLLRAMGDGFRHPLALTLGTATGGTRLTQWQAVALRDEAGLRTGMASFGTDVTETHRLRSATDVLADSIDRTTEEFLLLDADHCVEWVNKRFASAVGQRREALVGQHVADLARRHPSCEAFAILDVRCMAGVAMHADERKEHPDGREEWFRTSFDPVKDEQGTVRHYLSVKRDITKEKARQMQLVRLSGAVHASSEGIAVTDASGRFVVVNHSFARLHGRESSSSLVGVPWDACLATSEASGTREEMQRALQRRGEWTGDVAIGDGGDGRVARYALSALDGGGLVIAAHDMTARIASEQALVRSRDLAEAASRAQADFVTQVSHELRTPLNAVIGFSNIVLRRAAARLDAKDTDYLARVRDSGTTLLRIIDQILTHAKAEAGTLAVTRSLVDVAAVLEECMAQAEQLPRAPEVAMRLHIERAPAHARLDATRFRQVLAQLLSNACKFTARGEVSVALVGAADGGLRLTVTDTGPGIPPDRVEAIWRPFTQEEAGTARRFGGTGLGLPIARSLATLMGLQLEVTSAVGIGSTFAIRIPPDAVEDEWGTVDTGMTAPLEVKNL